MAFDYKKEYKEFYLPPRKPVILALPKMHYIAIDGRGNPNEEGGEYQNALGILYPLSYTLKMSPKAGKVTEGFFDYVVPPLEGLWEIEGINGFDYNKKEKFIWTSMIRIPDFFGESDLNWAKEEVLRKKKNDPSKAYFLTLDEGLVVEMMHIGSFDSEVESVAFMDSFLAEKGYENDFSPSRRHHEIYLSDARKTKGGNMKTVIRHPIRKK